MPVASSQRFGVAACLVAETLMVFGAAVKFEQQFELDAVPGSEPEVGVRGDDPVEKLGGAAFAPPALELAAGDACVGGEAAAELVHGELVGELAGGGDRERARRLPAEFFAFEAEFGGDDEGASLVEHPV